MTKVKLCGLTRAEDALWAMRAEADYVGFVLARSKREVAPETVRDLLSSMRDYAREMPSGRSPDPVLVLVDRTEDEILRLADRTGVRHVQLCGDEPPDVCAHLRSRDQLTVWKAWSVRGTRADEELAAYVGRVDAVLLDAYKPGARGGTGRTFVWDDILAFRERLGADTPIVVAGGLTPDTVAELVRRYSPFAVDVSSGIETDGRKDPKKMQQFVNRTRSTSLIINP